MCNAQKEPEIVSNMFNDFLINTRTKLAENCSNVLKNEIVNINKNVFFDNNFFKKIENSDVLRIVNRFKDDNAASFVE